MYRIVQEIALLNSIFKGTMEAGFFTTVVFESAANVEPERVTINLATPVGLAMNYLPD